jgi:hypothetical protein
MHSRGKKVKRGSKNYATNLAINEIHEVILPPTYTICSVA